MFARAPTVCSSVFGRAFDSLTDNVTGHKLITREPRRFSFTRFAERRIEITTARRQGRVADEASANYCGPTARAILSKCNPAGRSICVPSIVADSSSHNEREIPLAASPSRSEAGSGKRAKRRVYMQMSFASFDRRSIVALFCALVARRSSGN